MTKSYILYITSSRKRLSYVFYQFYKRADVHSRNLNIRLGLFTFSNLLPDFNVIFINICALHEIVTK